MRKISRKKVTDLIYQFENNPKEAFELFLDYGCLINTIQEDYFWDWFKGMGDDELLDLRLKDASIFQRLSQLHQFFQLKEIYEQWRGEWLTSLLQLNPDPTTLLKTLFLCLEIGDCSPQQNNLVKYSEESLGAIKNLLRYIIPRLDASNHSEYSEELANHCNVLIQIQVDIESISDFVDAHLWANVELFKDDNGLGFILKLPAKAKKTDNLYILNELKTAIRQDYYRKESHSSISGEEHFKKVDQILKTNEGLATLYISGAEVISQPEGTTHIKVDADLLEHLDDENPEKRDDAVIQIMKLMHEQNLHLQILQALSKIYHPNDEINIHEQYVEIEPNVFISIYELLSAMSCLIAYADIFRYFASTKYKSSLGTFKRRASNAWLFENPSENIGYLEESLNSWLIKDLNEIENREDTNFFNFFEESQLVNWLKQIEELKSKSLNELRAIINLFSKLDSSLPFNPIYKIEDRFYFSYIACGPRFNLNRLLYDYYISAKIFSNQNRKEEEHEKIGKSHLTRDINFCNSMRTLFENFTPYVKANLKYGGDKDGSKFGQLFGEFDVVAYFEQENIIIPIQVKLSNATPRTEKRKMEWIEYNIKEKGLRQVTKDIKLLSFKEGLSYLAQELGYKSKIINPHIYPIIVTDNFFADHQTFSREGIPVNCISYFELKNLLLNQKIHSNQNEWISFTKENVAKSLMKAIDDNIFWSFLDERAEKFTLNKALNLVNQEHSIKMVI